MLSLLKYFDYPETTMSRKQRMRRAANKAKSLGLAMRNKMQLRITPEKPSNITIKSQDMKDMY